MKTKNLWLVVIALLSFMILTACTSSETDTPVESSDAAVSEPSEEAAEPTAADAEPPYELVVAHFVGDVPADMAMVEEALNEILLEKINATVKLVPLGFGVYNEQTNLMLSSNEKLDLLVSGVGLGFSGKAASGQLLPLNDLLDQYGQGIVDNLGPEYAYTAKIGGQVYGIPTQRDFADFTNLTCRADLIEKYNIDLSQVEGLEDIATTLEPIKDGEPDLATLMTSESGTSFLPATLASYVDPLGDSFGVLMNQGQSDTLEVVNLFETTEYAAWLDLYHQWYTNGYVLKDVATQSDQTKASLVKNGKVACYLNRAKPGFDAQEEAMIAMDLVSVQIEAPLAKTSSVANVMWSIPINSQNPEKAMQLLNLLYTDPEVVNMLDWGIEGTHYVKASDHMIEYPSGIDAGNVGYASFSWMWGDQFLSYVLTTADPNIWEETKSFNDGAMRSRAMGFIFDASPVTTEIAAVQNVYDQYRMGLETGTTDLATELPKFIEALKDAGINNIIAEKQRQLDAWLAANQ